MTSFWDFDWGATLQRDSQDCFPDETIFATAYESAATMKGPKPGWDKDMHFVVSSDFFRSAHRKLVSCGNQFELIGSQAGAPARPCAQQPTRAMRCCHSITANSFLRTGQPPQSSSAVHRCLLRSRATAPHTQTAARAVCSLAQAAPPSFCTRRPTKARTSHRCGPYPASDLINQQSAAFHQAGRA